MFFSEGVSLLSPRGRIVSPFRALFHRSLPHVRGGQHQAVTVLTGELATLIVICWCGVVRVMRYICLAIPVSTFFMPVFAVRQLGETVTRT